MLVFENRTFQKLFGAKGGKVKEELCDINKTCNFVRLGQVYRYIFIYLKWIFRKWEGVVGTGWSWLRIGTGAGRLWVR